MPDTATDRYAITPADKVLGATLAQAPWDVHALGGLARWAARCERINALLGHYGLGRN